MDCGGVVNLKDPAVSQDHRCGNVEHCHEKPIDFSIGGEGGDEGGGEGDDEGDEGDDGGGGGGGDEGDEGGGGDDEGGEGGDEGGEGIGFPLLHKDI